MNFNLDSSLEILIRTPDVLDAQLNGLSSFWAENKEAEDRWSAKEVVAHLIHAEQEDWIPRIKIILADDDKKFTPFNPSGFDEIISGKALDDLLAEFRSLRNQSIIQLKEFNLTAEDLDKTGIHPAFGEVTLRELLSTWTTHDLNHLYQISRVIGKKYTDDIGPWKAYLRIVRD